MYLLVYLSINLSVSVYLAIFLSIYLSTYLSVYLQAWKRSSSAWLPQSLNLAASKSQVEACDTDRWLRLQWRFLSPSFARYSRTDFVSPLPEGFGSTNLTSPLQFATEMNCSDMTCTVKLTVLHITTVTTYTPSGTPLLNLLWVHHGSPQTSFKNGELSAELTASYQCVLRFCIPSV